MSSKSKHPATSLTLYQQGLRHLQKRDFKQALKDARVCYRQATTPEHRLLLEQAAIARAKELQQGGLTPQAVDILQELLSQPLQDIAVRNATPELLHKLGILDRYPQFQASLQADPELQARLNQQAADNIVVQPHANLNVPRDVRETADKIRQAWELITANREAEGLELLQDIPRQSPFADWRLFLRGLAAYYRQDLETQTANWERLAEKRIPARLAKLLVLWRQPRKKGLDPQEAIALDALERAAWGASLCDDLAEMESRSNAGSWESVAKVLQRIHPSLRKHAPETLQAVTKTLRDECITQGLDELLAVLKKTIPPPEFDPHWYQTEALIMEGREHRRGAPQTRYEFDRINDLWKRFIPDLENINLAPDDRKLGRALIWKHLGDRYASQYLINTEYLDAGDEFAVEKQREDKELDADALSCFDRSLEERPDLRATHEARCRYLANSERFDEALVARQALLARHPDDAESLMEVALDLAGQEKYASALPYVERLIKLKPTDAEVEQLAATILCELARHAALKKQWATGRECFRRLFQEYGGKTSYLRWIRRGVFETAAGDPTQTAHCLAEAIKECPHAGVLSLAFAIESVRYRLPKATCAEFQQRWEAEIASTFDPPAAAEMCRLMITYVDKEMSYTGRPKHIKLLIEYLKRGLKAKSDSQSMVIITAFLMGLGNQKTLLKKYVTLGRSRFPTVPDFHLLLGKIEFEKGPDRCQIYVAERHLDQALKHADPVEHKAIISIAQGMLDSINHFRNARIDPAFQSFFDRFRQQFEAELDDA